MKRYQVKIDDTVLSQLFTLDDLLNEGLLDDYDVNIKVRAINEKTWRIAREYPFCQSETNPIGYRIDEYGQVHRTGTTNRSSNTSRLDVSPESLFFTKSGGSRTITLTTNGQWKISLDAASWVHLTKNGNSLSVRVDYNYSLDNRTDHFRVKSGIAEKTIKIYQSGSVDSVEYGQVHGNNQSHSLSESSMSPSSSSSNSSSSSSDNDGCSWILWLAIGIAILIAIFS